VLKCIAVKVKGKNKTVNKKSSVLIVFYESPANGTFELARNFISTPTL